MIALPEKLSREIERVAILREVFYQRAALRQQLEPWADLTNVKKALVYLNIAIEDGHAAAGSRDERTMMDAVRKLEGCRP